MRTFSHHGENNPCLYRLEQLVSVSYWINKRRAVNDWEISRSFTALYLNYILKLNS